MKSSSARQRKSTSDTPGIQQSPSQFLKPQSPSLLSRDRAGQSTRQRLGASFDSSFSGSPSGPPGIAVTVAASAAAVPGSAAAASLAESSSAPSSLSSSEGQRTCTVCGENWLCESKEREYFIAKGLHAPRRCGKCRRLKMLELVAPGGIVANDSSPASDGPKDNGIALETEAEHNAGASCSVRHNTYRGTNLQGIGFVYVGEVSSSGRQEGFGSQVTARPPRFNAHIFNLFGLSSLVRIRPGTQGTRTKANGSAGARKAGACTRGRTAPSTRASTSGGGGMAWAFRQ
jgi:hypothetical protein